MSDDHSTPFDSAAQAASEEEEITRPIPLPDDPVPQSVRPAGLEPIKPEIPDSLRVAAPQEAGGTAAIAAAATAAAQPIAQPVVSDAPPPPPPAAQPVHPAAPAVAAAAVAGQAVIGQTGAPPLTTANLPSGPSVPRSPVGGPPPPGPDSGKNRKAIWIPIVAAIAVVALVATFAIVAAHRRPSVAPVTTPTPSATASATPTPTASDTPTPTPTPTTDTPSTDTPTTVTPTTPTAPPSGPPRALTGLPGYGNDGAALCIKIENSIEARPQLGLDSADVVFEEVVEGGITRFMAIYQSNIPPQVEPVRSMRPMDPNIALAYGCPLIFSGGQTAFLNAARKSGIQMIYMDRGDPGFTRDSKRQAPHNVIGDTAKFVAQIPAAKNKPPAAPWAFAASADASTASTAGTATQSISVGMSTTEVPVWKWDAKSSRWLRFEGSKPATVMDGTQLSATNVVVLTVNIVTTNYKDPIGTPVPETEIIGSGKGLLASGGKSVAITWSKASATSQIVMKDASGNPVTLTPGNTWIELMPSWGTLKVS